jgi:hypothetical protein
MVCAQTLMFPGKHCGGGEEVEVTFILNTNAEILAAWLMENWRTPYGASEGRLLQGQRLGQKYRHYQTKGTITLGANVMLVSKPNDEGVEEEHPIHDAFKFVLQPLAAERVEVRATYRFDYVLLADLARLLEEMARRWPELRDTLECRPGYWYFDDHLSAKNETQQKLLDAFTERLQQLKIKPANPAVERRKPPAPALALQGKYSCGAVFYVDGATAREVCNWLTENWRRRNEEPASVWTYAPDYHDGRRYQTTPIREATDDAGRVLLTVGIVETETPRPDVLGLLLFGLHGIPQDQFATVQDTPRALEILIIQAGADLVQVEARCNAVLLLDGFAQLLRAAKTAYGARLRNIAPTFGVMDAAPPGKHARMDAYFTARTEEFRELVMASARAEEPIGDDGSETPASEAARDDGPAAVINTDETTQAQTETARDEKKPRGRSKPTRQANILKLFEKENQRDLTIAQMAKSYGVHPKTISRDLKELGYVLKDGVLQDNSPP